MGIADFGTAARLMRRVTVAGDVPVGVDGRRGTLRAGRGRPETGWRRGCVYIAGVLYAPGFARV